jgi:hypothetical protein
LTRSVLGQISESITTPQLMFPVLTTSATPPVLPTPTILSTPTTAWAPAFERRRCHVDPQKMCCEADNGDWFPCTLGGHHAGAYVTGSPKLARRGYTCWYNNRRYYCRAGGIPVNSAPPDLRPRATDVAEACPVMNCGF